METEWNSPEAMEELSLSEFWQSLQHRFAEFVTPPRPEAVLDVACGNGRLALLWGERAVKVIGVDPSAELLARAERIRHQAGVTHVSFRAAASDALPFGDGSFDVVSAFTVLANAPDPAALLAEWARVMRPGAIIGGMVPSSRLSAGRIDEYVAFHDSPPSIAAMLHQIARHQSGRFSEQSIQRLLLSRGFRAVRTLEQVDGLMLIFKASR